MGGEFINSKYIKMNKRHAKTTTTQKLQSIEFTLNTDVVKEISFTCLLYGGTINWGDEEIEQRNNTISDLNNSFTHKYTCAMGIVTIKITGTQICEFSIQDVKLTDFKLIDCDFLHRLYIVNCDLRSLKFDRSDLLVLFCGCNFLEELKVDTLPNMAILNCENNYIKHLDLTANLNLCCLECKCNNLSQIQISEQNTKLHYLHCSFNALSKNALDEVFTILHDAIGALGFELDFAYNPGTSEIDKSGFKELFWDVKNIYYEKMVSRFTEYVKG